ncbi:hypothetical protein C8Q70DRAFT_925535 [Cubamyces menziesii]|nr:hypothetical protein C8Q70DRAFT_925535 [Cubamyces menziesii]
MHCLFLGNLRHHCRDVWGLDVKDEGGSQKVRPHTPDEQRLWLDRVVGALQKKSHSTLKNIRKGYLSAIAQLNDIVPSAQLTKKDYIAALLDWAQLHSIDTLRIPPVLAEDTTDFHISEGPYDISKFRIITQEIIDVIRADIQNTILPSWLERPPKNFGSALHGKLKADQWRTVCTVNLTITLVRLWGVVGAAQRDRLLLDNFVHLVTAVDLATRRSMNPERAKAFDHHMLLYLQGLRDIFSHELVPNHHLSLHLISCLLLFGPVHGWWAYPFERYNGLLASLNINNLPNDIPLTFMRGFYSGAELRWLMDSITWPDVEGYEDMLSAYHASFRDAARGTRVSDILSLDPSKAFDSSQVAYDVTKQVILERALYDHIIRYMPPSFASAYDEVADERPRLAPYAQPVDTTIKAGLTFATRSHSSKNSYVFVSHVPNTDDSRPCPGQISQILLHTRLEEGKQIVATFLVVDFFMELAGPDAAHDPFRAYPELATRVCYTRTSSSVVVRLDDVIAHFAALVYTPPGIGEECIICRSLDRVRVF